MASSHFGTHLRIMNFRQFVGVLGRGRNPKQGLYLRRTTEIQKEHTHTPMLRLWFRNQDPRVRAGGNISCLREHDHCDRSHRSLNYTILTFWYYICLEKYKERAWRLCAASRYGFWDVRRCVCWFRCKMSVNVFRFQPKLKCINRWLSFSGRWHRVALIRTDVSLRNLLALVHPEDGGDTIIRNVGSYQSHTVSSPRKW
jgi:hypothetical protein